MVRTLAPPDVTRTFVKRDRAARLLAITNLLFQHPAGLTVAEIAERVGMHVRTIYRDLRAMQDELPVRVWQEGRRWGAERTSFLPPLKLTLGEAVVLFLSARLMQRHVDRRSADALSAFNKLASILPDPIARHVHATVASMNHLPVHAPRDRVEDLLATAWAEGRKVRIWYPSSRDGEPPSLEERLVSPYFLEPNLAGHTLYLIGHDTFRDRVRTFTLERIQRAELTGELFQVPASFHVAEFLRHAWGISDEDLVDVHLRFHNRLAVERVQESRWHASQQTRENVDGTLDVLYRVGGLQEITPWILGWGASVEVLAPPELRQRVAQAAEEMSVRYRTGAVVPAGVD